jgi:hypothetical protein
VPDPSVADPALKPHEDSVPYERFKEVNDQLKQIQAQLDAAQAPPETSPEPEPSNGQVDWAALGLSPPQQVDPNQQIQYTQEQIEEQVRDGMYNRPLATMQPIMQEMAQQTVRQELQKLTQVRRIPDFQKFESSYYNIPDDIVYQAQSNPEVVRYLIAKHQATLQGTAPPPAPASMQQNLPTQNNPAVAPVSPTAPAEPPKTMKELQAQWEAEGERKALEKMRNQSGLTSEPTTTINTPPTDSPELDEYGKKFMQNLGIAPEDFGKVAKRLPQG